MTLQVQVLQDATTDHSPLLQLAGWIREHGDDSFLLRYKGEDFGADIVDLGDLHQDLAEWYEPTMGEPNTYQPAPPDIREWLQKEIKEGRCLAWISW